MSTTTDLKTYLERTLGVTVELRSTKVAGLPLYLAHAYRLLRTRLFERDFLFAEARSVGGESVARRVTDAAALQRAVPACHVALVLPHLGRAQRARLIATGVPFIVPGRQMYLPTALIDLRERFPRAPTERPKRISAAAQLVVLRQLRRRDVEGKPLSELANDFGYTAMTLTNVREELVAAELCAEHGEGRAKPLRFATGGRDLWKRVLPLLRTPVKKTVRIGVIRRGLPVIEAGLTALARQTMLDGQGVRTVAADHRALRNAIAKRTVLLGAADDESATQVEVWAYDPFLLADNDVVDPLSLWLSLRGDADERVQAALSDLLEAVKW